jgi:hypothetical protein
MVDLVALAGVSVGAVLALGARPLSAGGTRTQFEREASERQHDNIRDVLA